VSFDEELDVDATSQEEDAEENACDHRYGRGTVKTANFSDTAGGRLTGEYRSSR
jgi:hypothetical protein